MPVADEIAEILVAKADALIRRDRPSLVQLMHLDFVYVNARGDHFGRDTYLANYVDPPDVVWKSQTIHDLNVANFSQCAVATMRLEDVVMVKGTDRSGTYRTMSVFCRNGGTWFWCAGQTVAAS